MNNLPMDTARAIVLAWTATFLFGAPLISLIALKLFGMKRGGDITLAAFLYGIVSFALFLLIKLVQWIV